MELFDYRGGIEEVYSNAHFPAAKILGDISGTVSASPFSQITQY